MPGALPAGSLRFPRPQNRLRSRRLRPAVRKRTASLPGGSSLRFQRPEPRTAGDSPRGKKKKRAARVASPPGRPTAETCVPWDRDGRTWARAAGRAAPGDAGGVAAGLPRRRRRGYSRSWSTCAGAPWCAPAGRASAASRRRNWGRCTPVIDWKIHVWNGIRYRRVTSIVARPSTRPDFISQPWSLAADFSPRLQDKVGGGRPGYEVKHV